MDRAKDVTLIFILGTMLSIGIFSSIGSSAFDYKKQSASVLNSVSHKEKDFYFENLSIEAQAVYVWDIKDDKILFEKNSTFQLPLASLNKIMTAIVALEGDIGYITVGSSDILSLGDSGLKPKEIFKKEEIAKLMLTFSSNDAATAIASNYNQILQNKNFVALMNDKAFQVGLNQTYYLNESGLDLTKGVSGGYGSAKDIAKLIYYGFKNYPEVFSATTQKTNTVYSNQKNHLVKNTNLTVETIPGILASKTGFTDMAQGNLAIIFNAGLDRPIVVVVLGSTQDGRFDDVQKLILATIKTIGEEI